MPTTEIPLIEQSTQKTYAWINDLAQELGRPEDQHYAFRVLRAFLHTLRDRMPVEETAHLAAQLPELLRGVYFEGWRPHATPQRYHDLDSFLERLAKAGDLAGETEAAYAGEAAARVMHRRLAAGELDKVALIMPRPVADYLTAGRSGRAPA